LSITIYVDCENYELNAKNKLIKQLCNIESDRLKVSVCIALFMDVGDSTDNLSEADASFLL